MYGFLLDENKDVKIVNGDIQLISGNGLTRQTVECVLGTNKGEWCLNTDEGIRFENMLGKYTNGNSDVIRSEIEEGLSQVDSSFFITNFRTEHDKSNRKLNVSFSAQNNNGTIIQPNMIYE